MVRIENQSSLVVMEYGLCLLKRDSVLLKVICVLVWIPGERHHKCNNNITTIYIQYKNRLMVEVIQREVAIYEL